jgi:tetratricopeptide (TPR) repeat protein
VFLSDGRKWRWGLLLGGLYLFQWVYLAVVGWPAGIWDLAYTQAENRLEKKHPYSQASVARFRNAAHHAEKLVPEDGRVARTYHDLGTLLMITGRVNEARVYLTRALRLFERVDGEEATWVGITCWRLADAELQRGRVEQSLNYLRRADAILLRTLGKFSPNRVRVATACALRLRDPKRAQELLTWHRLGDVELDPITKLALEQITQPRDQSAITTLK